MYVRFHKEDNTLSISTKYLTCDQMEASQDYSLSKNKCYYH
jgi:hypothetical protein